MAKIEYQEKDGKVFCPLINKWLVAKPEEKVRQRYICTLVFEEAGTESNVLISIYYADHTVYFNTSLGS